MQKQCTKCGNVKDASEFYRWAKSPDGLRSRCKACWATANAAYHIAHRDRIAASHSAWRTTHRDEIAASAAATVRTWRAANPELTRMLDRARNATRRAVQSGRLIKPNACEACKATDQPVTAAHHDYTQPLNVRWLCWPCHVKWDKAEPKLRH